MTFLNDIYNNSCNQAQLYLATYIPEIPQDVIRGTFKSFTYSFTVSLILSGGSPIAALQGGALAILASTIYATSMVAIGEMRNKGITLFEPSLGAHLARSRSISEYENYCATSLGFVISLYIGDRLGLNTINLASITTIFINAINYAHYHSRTPLMGTIVV